VYHLIKKDWLVQKRSVMLSLLLMLFFTVSFSSVGPVGLSISIVTISYMLALGASAMEEKNNNDITLISLPIKKLTIVLSKYMSIYVFAAYAILINFIISVLVNLLHISEYSYPFTLNGVLGGIAGSTLFFSITLPLVFKYGYLKSKIASYLLFFGIIFGGAAILSTLDLDKWVTFINGIPQFATIGIVAIALIILYVVSIMLSLRLYRNREF